MTISPVPIIHEVVVPVAFVLIASVSVAIPVLMNLILGSRAEQILIEMKEWLEVDDAVTAFLDS